MTIRPFELSIIIPAYNEAESIGAIVTAIQFRHPNAELIVIDDGSSDKTAEIAKQAGAAVHRHPYNMGNGAAIKSGIRASHGDVLVLMDGDGQHDPDDIEKLLCEMSGYDMVVAARTGSDHATLFRGVGNQLCNWLATYVAKFKIVDLTSGFRVVKSDIARSFLYLLPNTYSYPTTLTLGVLRTGRSLKYVPVQIHKRKGGASNISVVRDGVRFFMMILKICTLYSPLRIFLPVSAAMFFTGLLYYFYTFMAYSRFTNMSALLFLTAVIIFMMGLISEQINQLRFERSDDGICPERDESS
jgi:glycosyltransferase involved in cell wall biosynthesis